MPIKDQCQGCKNLGNPEICPNITSENYDGLSCDKYQKKGISLEKIGTPTPEPATDSVQKPEAPKITPEYLKSITDIHGWLSFFFFAILAGSVLSLVMGIVNINMAEYSNSIWLVIADISLFVLMIAIAGATVYAFVERRPDAVYLGMLYVAIVFISRLISLINGDFDEGSYLNSSSQVIRGVIWGVVWLCYLLFSEQVKETIPKTYRKCTGLFYTLLAAVIIVPIFCIAAGVGEIRNSYNTQESAMLQRELNYGEYTDGRIIFERPLGYTCESQDIETSGTTLKVFTLENTAGNTFTICSDYNTDFSQEEFESYWESWQDESAKDYPSQEMSNEVKYTNNNKYFMKVTRYNIDGTLVYWMFALIYNSSLGKEAVVSYYSTNNNTEPVETLLSSICFN